jgi:cbb3-type cytochrome oxidase subunit 3
MYRTFYDGMGLSWLPTASMAFFAIFFLGVILKAFVFNGSKDFERVASLPLDENEVRK